MPLSLDQYRSKLVAKIIKAASQQDVERFCSFAIKSLLQHGINKYVITRFISKTINELGAIVLVDRDIQQCKNIVFAKNLLSRILQITNSTTS